MYYLYMALRFLTTQAFYKRDALRVHVSGHEAAQWVSEKHRGQETGAICVGTANAERRL